MHTHPVIRARKGRVEFAVVPVGDEEVGVFVIVKVSNFNMGVPPHRLACQQHTRCKLVVAKVE